MQILLEQQDKTVLEKRLKALPIPLMTTFNAVYQTTQLNKLYKE